MDGLDSFEYRPWGIRNETGPKRAKTIYGRDDDNKPTESPMCC